jgi:hypothetical protein
VTNDPAGNILRGVVVRLERLSHRPPGFDYGQLCQIVRSPLPSSLPFFLFLVYEVLCEMAVSVLYNGEQTQPFSYHMHWHRRLFTLGIVNLVGACN